VRVLLDHCVPRRFGRLLTGHQVRTAYEMGWSGLGNGVLLAQACQQFDVFLTVDQNVQFQQNLSTLPLPIVVLAASNNRYETLAPYASGVLDWLSRPLARELVRIDVAGQVVRVLARHPQP
jgi:CheY-like chemotaxis protein